MREEVSLNIEKISKNIYYPPAHCTPPPPSKSLKITMKYQAKLTL